MSSLLKVPVIVCLLCLVSITGVYSAAIGRLWCFDNNSDKQYAVRVKVNDETGVTGIQAYVDDSDPATLEQPVNDAGCTSSTVATGLSDIYTLSFNEGVCGSNDGVLIRLLGTSKYIQMNCDSQLSYSVSSSVLTVGPYDDLSVTQFFNPYQVKFFAISADNTNVPLDKAYYLENIKFRLTYQEGEKDSTLTNMGRTFHVAFTEQAAAKDLRIQIVTASLGTVVTVTDYDGDESYNVDVRRDRMIEIVIDDARAQYTSNTNSWNTEQRTIKLHSHHENIGVRVISRESGSGSSYVAIPDKSLGTSYQGLTLQADGDDKGELLIIATKDDTDVTITYNGYNTAALNIDSTAVTGSPATSVVTLEEGEVFHIYCDSACKEIGISADEKVGVIFGAQDESHNLNPDTGDVMTQLTPIDRFDDYFVVSNPQSYSGQFVINTDDPSDTFVVVDNDAFTTTTVNPLYQDTINTEQFFGQDIGYFFHAPGDANTDPSLLQIPSVAQWNWKYYVYMKEGPTYKLTFIGKNLLDIEFYTGSATTDLSGSTFNDQGVPTTTSIEKIGGGASEWEQFEIDVQIQDTSTWEIDQGLIEFRSPLPWNTFYLLVFEEFNSHTSSYLPFGIRFAIEDCSGLSDPMRPANGVDDDCDGRVDEEILNGVDDDGNGGIDEDVAWYQDSGITGIFVDRMTVDVPGSASDLVVINNRCSEDSFFNQDEDISFAHNTQLANEFEDLFVIDSGVVNAARFVESDVIDATVKFYFCSGNMTLCEDSCSGGARKKRALDELEELRSKEELRTARLRLPIVRNSTSSFNKEDIVIHPCSNSPLFWVSVILSMAILTVELAATSYFLSKRSQFARSLGY